MKVFHLGDILSVITGRLLSPRGMEGVYDILNYMIGYNLFSHQLPRAERDCCPELLKQHPALADAIPPDNFRDDAHVKDWLSEMVSLYGDTLSVEPVPVGAHAEIDPLAELSAMTEGHKPIIAVVLGGTP